MEIIRYFCIVKRFNCYFRTLCLTVFIFLTTGSHAQADSSRLKQMDSVRIYLLTCSPGQEIWSLYGHTAIRIQDPVQSQDLVINYGMFNFRQKNFILNFIFGLTDYEMGIVPFQTFMIEYARQGRGVIQQQLHLSAQEKASIIQAVAENYQPANRKYRYNYFYDNCTTRARDMLVTHLDGKTEYVVDPTETPSYREMIHEWNEKHRWARFGNDLLLGVKADFKTDYVAQQFLPERLREDFAKATVVQSNGRKNPLVDAETEILTPNSLNAKEATFVWDSVSPSILFLTLLVVIALVSLWELKRAKTLWILDLVLLTLDGLAGLILLAMIFSQHPTVSLNFQILLLNPLSVIFVYSVINKEVKGKYHRYWTCFALCILLFMIGGIFQDYAEGMYFLALTLLIRVCINQYITRKPTCNR